MTLALWSRKDDDFGQPRFGLAPHLPFLAREPKLPDALVGHAGEQSVPFDGGRAAGPLHPGCWAVGFEVGELWC
jgi:hypothetical protein